jgi:hypothetical protein
MFAISVPGSILHYRNSREEFRDGWIARAVDRPGGWYLTKDLQRSHRWGAEEKAASAALLIAGFLPDCAGKMVVIKIERLGRRGWRQV